MQRAAGMTMASDEDVPAPGKAGIEPFGVRLAAIVRQHGPLCIGLDPSRDVLEAWGQPDTARGLKGFARKVLPHLVGRVGIVKPQIAFFERFGSAGIAVLETVIGQLRDAKVLVILDAKRHRVHDGGIRAGVLRRGAAPGRRVDGEPILGSRDVGADGSGGSRRGSGLVRPCTHVEPGWSAVPGGGDDGRPAAVRERIRRGVRLERAPRVRPFVGVVVGATVEDARTGLEGLDAPILAPGVGHQGATLDGVAETFGAATVNVIPSISRGVLLDSSGFARAIDRAVSTSKRVHAEAVAHRRSNDSTRSV